MFNIDLSSFNKEQQLMLIALVITFVVGIGVIACRQLFETKQSIIIEENNTSAGIILVHVCGAVNKEGVYSLTSNDRVIDALKLANGARGDADLSVLNLAQVLKDGEKIFVPIKINELGVETAKQKKVSLNKGDQKSFDTLPGIGPTMAKAIVAYRKTNGPFTCLEDLQKVPKIGKAKFNNLKDLIML